MRIAQQLYEGIDIKGQGTVGIITYLRTDSTRVSEEAERLAREYISSIYGAEYVADTEKKKDGGKNIQDAHEAIRPTDISRTPASLKESLSRDQFRLYQLIWKALRRARCSRRDLRRLPSRLTRAITGLPLQHPKSHLTDSVPVYVQPDEEKAENNVLLKGLDEQSVLTKEDFEKKAALYAAAGTLHRGVSCKGTGGTGNRTA